MCLVDACTGRAWLARLLPGASDIIDGRIADFKPRFPCPLLGMETVCSELENGLIVVPIADVHTNDGSRRMNSAAVGQERTVENYLKLALRVSSL